MTDDIKKRLDVVLVAGGKYHDIDFARLELLKLLAEDERIRTRVYEDYSNLHAISNADFLITYTCDVRPTLEQQKVLRDFVANGKRWLALHGTNSALDLNPPNPVSTPRCFPVWAELLGTQFISHPPIQPFPVELADPDHWLVEGIDPFETDDELYLCEYHNRETLHPLLKTEWLGETPGFEESDWQNCDPVHLIMYLKNQGEGEILYNNLGHCRGHWDMTNLGVKYYPNVERCSWEIPQYHELLRRGIRWALGQQS